MADATDLVDPSWHSIFEKVRERLSCHESGVSGCRSIVTACLKARQKIEHERTVDLFQVLTLFHPKRDDRVHARRPARRQPDTEERDAGE
jgi:hypothetical protein